MLIKVGHHDKKVSQDQRQDMMRYADILLKFIFMLCLYPINSSFCSYLTRHDFSMHANASAQGCMIITTCLLHKTRPSYTIDDEHHSSVCGTRCLW